MSSLFSFLTNESVDKVFLSFLIRVSHIGCFLFPLCLLKAFSLALNFKHYIDFLYSSEYLCVDLIFCVTVYFYDFLSEFAVGLSLFTISLLSRYL